MAEFGVGDASFQAAGGVAGIERLVDDFYAIMEEAPFASRIRHMHPQDLQVSRDKLARFLCGWLGGPRRFQERYGSIVIPSAHKHLPIGEDERDAWLLCMRLAVERQPWADDFKAYFLQQIAFPARLVRNQ